MPKLKKTSVSYRGTVSKTVNCGKCQYMQKNGGCEKVTGMVDRLHVCDLFRAEK